MAEGKCRPCVLNTGLTRVQEKRNQGRNNFQNFLKIADSRNNRNAKTKKSTPGLSRTYETDFQNFPKTADSRNNTNDKTKKSMPGQMIVKTTQNQ